MHSCGRYVGLEHFWTHVWFGIEINVLDAGPFEAEWLLLRERCLRVTVVSTRGDNVQLVAVAQAVIACIYFAALGMERETESISEPVSKDPGNERIRNRFKTPENMSS